VSSAFNATLKDYILTIEHDLEEHNALKVNLTLTSMFQQPTSGQEIIFHIASCTYVCYRRR